MADDIYNLISPADLSAVARLALAEEDRPANQFVFGNWFPNVLVDSITFGYGATSNRGLTDAMPFRTWTTEAPIGKRPGRVRKYGEMPPLSIKYPLTEYDAIMQAQALKGGQDEDLAEAIEGDVFDDIGRGVRAMENRMEIARADALIFGTASISENGVELEVDFGRDAGREVAVSVSWATAATATPLDDEAAVMETMVDEESLAPGDLVAFMNRSTIKLLKATAQYRSAFQSVRIHDQLPLSAINEIRNDFELPPIVEYNAVTNSVGGTRRKLMPDGKVLYLPRGQAVGDTQYGVPAMALQSDVGLERDDRPGPIAYMTRELDPLVVWTVVDGIGFPSLKDPNATFVLDVIP